MLCETNHERKPMDYEASTKMWRCPDTTCQAFISDEHAYSKIPVEYLSAMDQGLLTILDCADIWVIVGAPSSWLEIEYPRLKDVR